MPVVSATVVAEVAGVMHLVHLVGLGLGAGTNSCSPYIAGKKPISQFPSLEAGQRVPVWRLRTLPQMSRRSGRGSRLAVV